jgi:hypothetical protein
MRTSQATEALRVAREVAAIRLALKKCGYGVRKRPRQPVWTITSRSSSKIQEAIGSCYQLTYQPAPISSWVLYPRNNDSGRQALLKIIQGALKRQPAGMVGKIC